MFDFTALMAARPALFFVYPVIVDDEGNEKLGARLSCFSFDDALYVARREWDGATGTLVSSYGVDRGPGGGVMAFQDVDAKIDLTMTTGGKPIGWTGSGHSIVTLASGPWEALKGKTISWTARSTGLGEYEIDSTIK
jgi:hypothetical protein